MGNPDINKHAQRYIKANRRLFTGLRGIDHMTKLGWFEWAKEQAPKLIEAWKTRDLKTVESIWTASERWRSLAETTRKPRRSSTNSPALRSAPTNSK